MIYTWLIDRKFFNSHGLLYSRDEDIGDGYFVHNENVRKYVHGYLKVSMFVSLLAVSRTNYASILRRKVLELYYLNGELYDSNHSLFVKVIVQINDLMRISRDLYVRGDIAQFIDNVLDAEGWDVERDDIAKIKFFKPMSGVYDFGNDYEGSIERYRADVAIFNNQLRSMESKNRIWEAISELRARGMWINDKSLSEMTFELFGKQISNNYIPKLIARYEFGLLINSLNIENHGTSNEKTKETIRIIMKAASDLRAKGSLVNKSSLAREADLHLQTIYYQFKNVSVLTENLQL